MVEPGLAPAYIYADPLRSFFRANAITEGVADVSALLKEYKGLEDILWRDLRRRYGQAPETTIAIRSRANAFEGRGFGREDATIASRLLGAVTAAFETRGIEYVAFGGTALAYCRHDAQFTPWDDDVDLLIAAADVGRARSALGDVVLGPGEEGVRIITDREGGSSGEGLVLKAFFNASRAQSSYGWGFPYLDIWTYTTRNVTAQATAKTEAGKDCVFPFRYDGQTFTACTDYDDTRKWCATQVDASGKQVYGKFGYCASNVTGIVVAVRQDKWHIYEYPRRFLFPTQVVKFAGVNLRVPANVREYLHHEYKGDRWMTTCQVGSYRHRTEKLIVRKASAKFKTSVPCAKLARLHPEWPWSLSFAAATASAEGDAGEEAAAVEEESEEEGVEDAAVYQQKNAVTGGSPKLTKLTMKETKARGKKKEGGKTLEVFNRRSRCAFTEAETSTERFEKWTELKEALDKFYSV